MVLATNTRGALGATVLPTSSSMPRSRVFPVPHSDDDDSDGDDHFANRTHFLQARAVKAGLAAARKKLQPTSYKKVTSASSLPAASGGPLTVSNSNSLQLALAEDSSSSGYSSDASQPSPLSSQLVSSPCHVRPKKGKFVKHERPSVSDNVLIEGSTWRSNPLNGEIPEVPSSLLKKAFIQAVNASYQSSVGDSHIIAASGKDKNGLQINCSSDLKRGKKLCGCDLGLVAHNRESNTAMEVTYLCGRCGQRERLGRHPRQRRRYGHRLRQPRYGHRQP